MALSDVDGDGCLDVVASGWRGTVVIGSDDWTSSVTPAQEQEGQQLRGYPNPVGAEATVAFQLPLAGDVELSIYDASGRLVRKLAAGEFDVGQHRVSWDRRSQEGRVVPSGTYFYRLELDGQVLDTEKTILIR